MGTNSQPTVLQVVPSLVTGGVERGTIDVAASLVAGGWKAIVASAGGPMVREVTRAGALHVTLPVDSKNPWVMRRNVARLAALIDEHSVDLVHARSRAPAWSAWAAARQTTRPFVTTFHGTYNFSNRLKHFYNSVMTRGERVIAISDFIAAHIKDNYPVDPARIRVIHRGIDLERFDPARVSPERLIQLTKAWRLQDGVPVITLPGRLTRWKGQFILLDAITRLGHHNLRCLLIGSDQGRHRYRQALESAIAAKGLGGIVQIVDDCNDMPAAFMLSDVVVSASTDPEGFGRVMAEAQAMGRPVIASDHGGAREIVQDGLTGLLVPPGDAKALAAALAEILALDEGQRAEVTARGIAHIRAHFAKERMCARTLAVYREVLGLDG